MLFEEHRSSILESRFVSIIDSNLTLPSKKWSHHLNKVPSRKLTNATIGKAKSSSKVPWKGGSTYWQNWLLGNLWYLTLAYDSGLSGTKNCHLKCANLVHPSKLAWHWKTPMFNRNTSSNGGFSIVILVFPRGKNPQSQWGSKNQIWMFW